MATHQEHEFFLKSRFQNNAIPQVILFEGDVKSGAAKCAEDMAALLVTGQKLDLYRIRPEPGAFHTMVGIRDLITKTELLPYEGVRQVFLIEEAESLSPVCQNALLKLLEEPPTGTYLFLVCTHTAYLLPTLLSRCTILRFFSVRSLIMSESRASALIQRVLVDNLHGVGGVWHELQLELDTLSIQQGLDLLEDILIWARHQFLLPCVYDLVIEAREQLQFHVKLRHVIEALLLKISVTGTLS